MALPHLTALPPAAVNISTGATAIDEILGGGVETKAITEVYGEFRCGKTQLCHTMCVTSQLNEKSPGKVAFIDTEGTFRPKMVRAIAERFGMEPDSVLNNVVYCRAPTYERQIDALEPLAAMMATEPFKLVIMVSCFANVLVEGCWWRWWRGRRGRDGWVVACYIGGRGWRRRRRTGGGGGVGWWWGPGGAHPMRGSTVVIIILIMTVDLTVYSSFLLPHAQDSISACFRTDFIGRGELADRQQKLGVLMARLRKVRKNTVCIYSWAL